MHNGTARPGQLIAIQRLGGNADINMTQTEASEEITRLKAERGIPETRNALERALEQSRQIMAALNGDEYKHLSEAGKMSVYSAVMASMRDTPRARPKPRRDYF